jgi:ATP phosphoribosyltransferase regulatory subunit
MLTSPAEIIDALGGTKKVAEMLGVGASAISNYRRDGFPAAKHYALAKACEASGLAIDEGVFGGPPAAAPRHFRYDAAITAPVASPDGFLKDLGKAGYRQVETPILQPSDPFINRMGAEMQRRLYRFTDPAGEELCLRPDLTIPTVLDYVRAGRFEEARLCYQGTAFRYQPRGAGKPEEFTQTGLEIINGKTGDAAIEDDIEVLEKLLTIIQAAGVRDYEVHINDFDWLTDFLKDNNVADAAAREIRRKMISTKNLDDFRRLMQPQPKRETKIYSSLDADSIIAGRSGADIIARMQKKQAQAASPEISDETRDRLFAFLEKPPEAGDWLERRTKELADKLVPVLNKFVGLERMHFAPAISTPMAYYTGLSFEIHVPALGPRKVIASGGRYDDLVESLGAPHQIPAVGGAIALERLHEAATLQTPLGDAS